MQEKLIEILSGAKGWMTAAQIAEKGKWRSASHVGVELQLMEKAGRVARRKSPTAKQGNGMPATEWRHSDKHFDGDHVPDATKMIKTDPAPVFTQPAHDITIEANLRQQVAHLTDQLAAEKSNSARIKELESETAEARIVFGNIRKTLGVGADTSVILAIQKLQSDMRGLTQRAESLRLAKSENVALKTLNGEMPGFGALHKALSEGPFVVRCTGKPAIFANKLDNAKSAALSGARQKRRAEVFALVPVGKAVRGAEWVAK